MPSKEWLEEQVRAAVVDYNSLPDALGADVSAYVAEHVFKAQEADTVVFLASQVVKYRRRREQADGLMAELIGLNFEEEIAYALAVRHKCLEHNGPGSGPCKTDRERARIVLRLIAAKMNARLELDDDDAAE